MEQILRQYVMDDAVSLVLDELKRRVRQKPAAPVFAGISGIDCSGKTTFADALVKQASSDGLQTELVNVDDFIIPTDQRKVEEPPHVSYYNNVFDHAAFADVVRERGAIDGGQVVIGEGVFLFRREFVQRSEERRVGKECRSRWSRYQ